MPRKIVARKYPREAQVPAMIKSLLLAAILATSSATWLAPWPDDEIVGRLDLTYSNLSDLCEAQPDDEDCQL